ncbi:diphosphate--fructose-6-phosphate 1-phosphotransferase [Rubinisphaera brasiliensis]|uniref:Pyrophosphate--fructose 6-phosphate 1-phosphotransferase n=1 Tax=Rubinisphaera brasiliensis (strain ATCC 49424 / DSM 5305 / JCM 21570 / IAM 15109 / NBRC 103401 / IFAM 1448) TaxID=756272 RepID=F0SM09_RUBBR|nr:diphosphate--fructose-6-phosphate 1-phosphotransferase [Rubinisphaera brasiliensis]ADY59934.1 phosphofructokinase [Rubinisphaera brasiliensis DSM 5305]
MAKNMIVAQSGGPSPVINNTLRGIVETAREMSEIGTVYGGWHGIEGVLKEELLDLTAQCPDEIALLRTTPAAGSIGTCRYKLKDHQNEDFDRIIDIFKAHNIGYFVYIGGNDSMDTANKVANVARERGLDVVGIGGPKTIDNDVGDSEFQLIDHTPGYGSTARYWSNYIQMSNEENNGSCPADPVLVLQAMGRKIGYIPAAARLADPKREMPLQIYLAERKVTIEQMRENINTMLKEHGRAMVVVSEGLEIEGLEIPEEFVVRDSFGHAMLSSSKITVGQLLTNALNEEPLAVKGKARCNVPGTHQRNDIIHASNVDLTESYYVGQKAALLAAGGEHGYMASILRADRENYTVEYGKAPLSEVANSERHFPQEWITKCGTDVTDEFVKYARPLIGDNWVSVPVIDGRLRLARMKPIFADQKLDKYIPQADRS